MSNFPFPYICECGYNTMDVEKAAEHARMHEAEQTERKESDMIHDFREIAKHRVQLKRALRRTGIVVKNDAPTEELERMVGVVGAVGMI